MIDQHLQSADFVECFAADGQRGAEAVVQAAFNPLRQQHAGLEVGGDAQGLKARRKATVGAAMIERRDQPDFLRGGCTGLRIY